MIINDLVNEKQDKIVSYFIFGRKRCKGISMYVVTIHREDEDFDNINSPYLVFYLVKGIQNTVLPLVTLIESQIEHFALIL